MCEACPTLTPEQRGSIHHETVVEVPAMTPSDYVVWYQDYSEADKPRVGGKNASLGEMIGAGLPVPPGFAVTTEAYHTMRSNHELSDRVRALLGKIDFADPVALREISGQIRTAMEAVPVAADIEEAVRVAYAELSGFCNVENVPVAVRSSATAEDLPDASFAGQQDTYLWITGADNVVEHMKRCWSSIFTDRAMAYRHQTGHDHEVISMSVAIQKMVQPKAAGVAFTLNPTDGDRSQICIDSSWGFGEAVVSGEVTPDNFRVDKVLREVVGRAISEKGMEYRLNGQGVVEPTPIEDGRATLPSMTDDEVKAVAAMARRAEQHYGSPQDVEWAIDVDLDPPHNVVLLQSRPETVWSRKERKTVAKPNQGFMDGIVSTLIAPVHTRGKSSTVED